VQSDNGDIPTRKNYHEIAGRKAREVLNCMRFRKDPVAPRVRILEDPEATSVNDTTKISETAPQPKNSS
jgi:hypothetical protein